MIRQARNVAVGLIGAECELGRLALAWSVYDVPSWRESGNINVVSKNSIRIHCVHCICAAGAFHERRARNSRAFEASRTGSWKRRNKRRCIASCGAQNLMRESPEARLRVNMPIITNGSLSRAPVCGATNRLVEKGRGWREIML